MFDISWVKNNISDIILFAVVVAVYFIIKVLLKFLAEKIKINKSLSKITNYALLIIIIEFVKNRFVLSALFLKIANFVEVSLVIFVLYNLVVNVYIKDYLINYKKKQVRHILIDITKLVFLSLFILVILRTVFNVDLITILTPSAILTAVIGLSMKDTIGNLISGLIIQIEKPFDVGDWIKVGDEAGEVVEINWRYTKLRTLNNVFLIVPNNDISSGTLLNYNRPEKSIRMVIEIGVSYDTPPGKLKSAVLKVLNSCVYVDKNREMLVFLKKYNDFSIDYDILFWIKEYKFHREARDEVYSALWYEFKLVGIEIPFPIRTIIYKKDEEQEDTFEEKWIDKLGQVEIFANISREFLKEIITFSEIHFYPKNNIIIKENSVGDSMFVILDGEVEVFKDDKKIAELKEGNFFGEMSLLTGEKRSATVVAKTDCNILEISRSVFKIFLERDKKLMDSVNKIFEQRLSELKKENSDRKEVEKLRISLFAQFKKIFNIS